MEYRIRPIHKDDDVAIAHVIRSVLEEHGMNKPGTVYTDPTTDSLSKLFKTPKSFYFVVESKEGIVGGCGVYPTEGLPKGCAELVKLYLNAQMRGKGLGKLLLNKCAEQAKKIGYDKLYLESMPELNAAVDLYESVGYRRLNSPMGNSGHFACDLWMLKELQ